MPDHPCVIALVATRSRAELLHRLIESLQNQTLPLAGLFVTDNGPDPATTKVLKKTTFPGELVSPGKNLGFGGGLAAAGQRALEKFPSLTHFLIVDDDAILAPGNLQALVDAATRHSAGLVAPFLVDPAGQLQEVPEPVSWSLARAFREFGSDLQRTRSLAPGGYPMAWCIGPCLLLTKEAWLRAGPPRSDMMAYGDDVEFSLRLSAVSPAWADPSVTVIHAPPAASRLPPPADAAHYRKFGMLLQNLAFTCVLSPRPRHLPLYLPGNAKRFLRTFGFTPANLLEVLRRYLKGLMGIPAGHSTGAS